MCSSDLDIQGLLLLTIFVDFLGFLMTIFLTETFTITSDNWQISSSYIASVSADKKILKLIIFTAVLSLGMYLINFFYPIKLVECDCEVNWMTGIILGYSDLQLFIVKIIQVTKSFSNKMILTITFATSGLLVLLFGLVKQAGIILSIMIIMPLSFNFPEYLLSKITNERIDTMGEKNKRATILSIVNMGNNCMSIIFLFLSSQLIKYGVRNYCLVYGSILVIFSIYGIFEDGLSSERGKCKW